MALCIVTTALALLAAAGGPSAGKLTLDPTAAVTARLGYYPTQFKLSLHRPASVVKVPSSQTTLRYAVIKLGNGPKSETVVAVDEPRQGDWKIYIDKNHNGDLTDDGDGSWNKKDEKSGRTLYGVMDVTLRASYGTPTHETGSSPYVIGLYRFSSLPTLLGYRESGRTGSVKFGSKTHKVLLVENDTDAIFSKPAKTQADAKTTRPVWLLVDAKDDGKFTGGMIDARGIFEFDGARYEPSISVDGSSVKVKKTNKPLVELTPKPKPPPPLLASGVVAPDFTAEKWGGGDLKLSDYKGKIVIVDFWATWCGPCQKSMPHIEKVYQAVKSQNVAVVGVCVWDEKKAYEEWVPKNQDKYTFQFAFDPAGSGANSIASKLFNVSGIPTTYIIDKDGKVAASIVGYDDNDKRVEEELKKLGVTVGE